MKCEVILCHYFNLCYHIPYPHTDIVLLRFNCLYYADERKWCQVYLVLCIGCAICSTLCKELGLTAIGVCLAYDLVIFQQVHGDITAPCGCTWQSVLSMTEEGCISAVCGSYPWTASLIALLPGQSIRANVQISKTPLPFFLCRVVFTTGSPNGFLTN